MKYAADLRAKVARYGRRPAWRRWIPLPLVVAALPTVLIPPPKQSIGDRIRRLWRSRKAMSGLTQWIIDWGLLLAITVGAIYLIAAQLEEWVEAYKTVVHIQAPTTNWLWASSLVGWLLVPAIVGGVAGHVIASRIKSVKAISTASLFRKRKFKDRVKPLSRISWLGSYYHGDPHDFHFADCFVRQAHKNDWKLAQDHWEIMVADVMCTVEFSDFNRADSLRFAESFCKIQPRLLAMQGKCVVCDANS